MKAFTNFLFVPANKPERFEKALNSGADLICVDLEDSVPNDEKDSARDSVLTALNDIDRSKTAIRINGMKTAFGLADLLAIKASPHKPALLFIPMVEDAAELEIAASVLGDSVSGIVPLIETVRGLNNAQAIASVPAVEAVMFGGGDFSGELGVKLEWEPLFMARSQLVMACATAKKRCIDVPYIDMKNEDGLAQEARRVKALGFHAKAAIHPKQIAAIKEAMRPSDAEIEEAHEAIKVFENAGGAVTQFRGQMLEAPVVKRYRQILASI